MYMLIYRRYFLFEMIILRFQVINVFIFIKAQFSLD